ncbi:hypothetical protein [Rhizobium leguminosarum]|nr:hypothetical protein [Rhizobium leguminosarum]
MFLLSELDCVAKVYGAIDTEKTGVNSVMGVAPKTEEKGVSVMP